MARPPAQLCLPKPKPQVLPSLTGAVGHQLGLRKAVWYSAEHRRLRGRRLGCVQLCPQHSWSWKNFFSPGQNPFPKMSSPVELQYLKLVQTEVQPESPLASLLSTTFSPHPISSITPWRIFLKSWGCTENDLETLANTLPERSQTALTRCETLNT